MEALRNAATIICVSLLFFGVVLMLVPEGSMKKSFKSFCGIAIMAALIMSVRNITFDPTDFEIKNHETEVISRFTEKVSENELEVVICTVKNVIKSALEKNGFKNCNVDINTDISDNGSIFISRVTVICPSDSIEGVKKAVEALCPGSEVDIREVVT